MTEFEKQVKEGGKKDTEYIGAMKELQEAVQKKSAPNS